jgi:hypothetical protein
MQPYPSSNVSSYRIAPDIRFYDLPNERAGMRGQRSRTASGTLLECHLRCVLTRIASDTLALCLTQTEGL